MTAHAGSRYGALFIALAALVLAPPASAQEVETEEQEENCVCFTPGDGPMVFRNGPMTLENGPISWLPGARNRAVIGVMIASTDEDDGARIVEVTTDGPAEAAGLQSGDVIVAVSGRELSEEGADGLVDALSELEPGDAVSITYDRDGERTTVEIITDESTAMATTGQGFNWVTPRVGFQGLRNRGGDVEVIAPNVLIRHLSPGGLDLVALNPGLGEYFGTDEGVLVTAVEEDSALGLHPGDVIRSIGGRDVEDPAHVRSILDSYRADEAITFQIVRMDREMEVTGSLD